MVNYFIINAKQYKSDTSDWGSCRLHWQARCQTSCLAASICVHKYFIKSERLTDQTISSDMGLMLSKTSMAKLNMVINNY